MTYDPRLGNSPYLGMSVDDDDELVSDSVRQESPRSARRQSPVARWQSTPAYQGSAPVQGVQTTVRRASKAPQRGVAPQETARFETPAYAAQSMSSDVPLRRPIPSPPRAHDPVVSSRPAGSSLRPPRAFVYLGSFALRLLAFVARLAAIALSAAVVASAVLTDSRRYLLVQALNIAHALVPTGVFGRFVMETPFGGALRGDLAIASVLLFVFDWLCLVYASHLRDSAGRRA